MKTIYLILVIVLISSCNATKKSDNNISMNKDKEVVIEKQTAYQNNIIQDKTITFPSKDGLIITADLYQIENSKAFILLCHQAGFSRGEYIDTAKKLNKLGYSCLAIDQRSGKSANNISNETAKRAKEKGLKTKYLDAKQDIEAAIDYSYKLNKDQPIIIVGSSYSASLVLLIAQSNNKVKAVASFSPGEYLKGINLAESISDLTKPVFVTSSKSETKKTANVVKNIKTKVAHFKPEVKGIHGSRALWNNTNGNESYWKAFSSFLSNID